MADDSQRAVIAFVFRPREMSLAVAAMARQTQTQAICDMSEMPSSAVETELVRAAKTGAATAVKLSSSGLMDQNLLDLLRRTPITAVWTEVHSASLGIDPIVLLERVDQLSEQIKVIPIVYSMDIISQIISGYPGIRTIAIKGNEASGFVGTETTFTLYSAIRAKLSGRADSPGLIIWGGVALPEAAAAFLSTGARGIVFESVHWLTDLSLVNPDLRSKIAKLRPSHTSLVSFSLGLACRFFDKGNSKSVRELRCAAVSHCGDELAATGADSIAAHIRKNAIHPLESGLGREQLIPMGVEATFASSFVRRYGSKTETAVASFVDAIRRCCENSVDATNAFDDGPAALRMGTLYPFVQGAMSWITDVPEFALKVAEAGGLPTIALGIKDLAALDQTMTGLLEKMGSKPFAVNVITLPENPYREAHLAWIREKRPQFATIAAGEPSHASSLLADGIEVIYVAPNEELVKIALETGIRYVVCEGNEAGGHVGQNSTLTLAQSVLDLRDQDPEIFEGRTIILAGGIFNRETAFAAAMLGADAVQMGTAYLATEEIVSTGALTKLYQQKILDAQVGDTVVTGSGTGLTVRSLSTPKIEALCKLERDYAAGPGDEASYRRRIESLSVGSLFIAARGLDTLTGSKLDESTCLTEGQFMSGTCAGSLNEVRTIAQLHHELAKGSLGEGLPVTRPLGILASERAREAGVHAPHSRGFISQAEIRHDRPSFPERIAITAMSVVNSLGKNPAEVLTASLEMKSGITLVPQSRWDHNIYYDPRPRAPEKTYCKVGAFLDLDISRKDLGIPPQDYRTMTGATKITMWLAEEAIRESAILSSDIARDRIGVLISQNSGEAAGTLEDLIIRGASNKIVSAVKRVLNLSAQAEKAVEDEVRAGRIEIDDTTLLGRLNCCAAGLICNKYGFMGPSFSVSAACATSLVALHSAVQMIRNGVIDAAIVGGGEEHLSPMHFQEFSALGSLAGLFGVDRRPSETCRPFDADRDGMVLGEGGGMIVVERESLARRRGARIHAYIMSMGASNNHLGMVESASPTQEIAIRNSFLDAPYGPDQVDFVECHATATRQGDGEEVKALKQFYNCQKRTVLSSFKSQIGHTLGASGINSMIRGIMAMNSGTFPPTLNYEKPDEQIDIDGSGLSVLREPADWIAKDGSPRRMQVNAFGFGGSNYVVQLEQTLEGVDTVLVLTPDKKQQEEGKVESMALPEGIFLFEAGIAGDTYRIAVVKDTEKEALEAIESNEVLRSKASVAGKRMRALARHGIHMGIVKDVPSPLAFVFPGQGSHYAGMGRELYETFPVIRHWMDRAADIADFDILHRLFYDSEEDLQKTRWQQPALFTLEWGMVQFLMSLGIHPAGLAGHSLGELTALCLAGVYSFEDGFKIVNMRALCMDKACAMNVDPGGMLACDAPIEVLQEIIGERENSYITNINSPRQNVIGGDSKAIIDLEADLKKLGYRCTPLRVSMSFHSPIMRCIHDELEDFVAQIEFHPPKIPVLSNTTALPFPDDPEEIKRIVMAHLESPVQWMANVRSLWEDYGVRIFVEVGPREILSNIIGDTLDQAECIQTCLPSAEVMIYKTALAQLFAAGHLEPGQKPRTISNGEQFLRTEPLSQDGGATLVRHATTPLQTNPLEGIIQKEINSFILESFGKFIKPNILDTVKRTYDPSFTDDKLDSFLAKFMAGGDQRSETSQSLRSLERIDPDVQPFKPSSELSAKNSVKDAVGTQSTDITETIIRLIMEATGYERDEIEPDMDLKEDLSIRSSRLPVIMDAVEGHFGIKIELEDFIDVRTIHDIAQRISTILARQNDDPRGSAGGYRLQQASATGFDTRETRHDAIRRMVCQEVHVKPDNAQLVELSPTEPVIILSARGGTGLRRKVGDIFRRDYGANIVLWSFFTNPSDSDGDSFDLRTENGRTQLERKLRELEPPAGLVLIIDDTIETELGSTEDLTDLLTGFFSLLKVFTESTAKKFVLLINKVENKGCRANVLSDGVVGMFLSAALEFGYLQFRSVILDQDTSLSDAIRGSMDRSRKPLQTISRSGNVFAKEWKEERLACHATDGMHLGREDLVVFSGGGRGVTYRLARALVPFGAKIILLGTTSLDPDVDFHELAKGEPPTTSTVGRMLDSVRPVLDDEERREAIGQVMRAVEVVRNVELLRSQGIDAFYFPCDVTDPERTRSVIEEISRIHGRITGVVHGAGILKDSFVRNMQLNDFSRVVDVKFLGAWNLFEAAAGKGLKFFWCLSSVAAIQGNPGQVNYAAGNRMMSALMSYLAPLHESIGFKSLMLPPIEGDGMAEDEEIRALMKRMNAGYVHVDEMAELFCRELSGPSLRQQWVLFMRTLPELSTVAIDKTETRANPAMLDVGTSRYQRQDFPMIDSVANIDLVGGELEAIHAFSREKDLWISDHKPFKFLRHPLVSAIMALETFMEAALILYPYLKVIGIRDAWFLEIIECPPDVERLVEIVCRRQGNLGPQIVCDAFLAAKEMSDSGKPVGPSHANYKAQVILAGDEFHASNLSDDFPDILGEFDTPPVDHARIEEQYDHRSEMQGRYRVINSLDGTCPEGIRGRMVYKRFDDFSAFSNTHYQYAPYLLEALMQLVNFFLVSRNHFESRSMIPYRIGQVTFSRTCKDGENVILEGFLRNQNENGIIWDARGLDEQGATIMIAKSIMFRWFSV